MMAAESLPSADDETPALQEALRLLEEGLWPVPVTAPTDRGSWIRSPGKQPSAGKGWGKERPTKDWLREHYRKRPKDSLGIKLGKVGKVVDIEIDEPETGEQTLLELFDGEVVPTRGFQASRGRHQLFWWDDRLAGLGVIEGDKRFPGLGLRFGSADDNSDQVQSVVPPSPINRVDDHGNVTAGPPRQWNSIEEIAYLPECFFENLQARLAVRPINGPRPGPGFSVPTAMPGSDREQAHWHRVLQSHLRRIEDATEGNRHNAIRSSTRALAGYLHLGAYDEATLKASILATCDQQGYDHRHCAELVDWAVENGKKSPLAKPSWLTQSTADRIDKTISVNSVSDNKGVAIPWEPPFEDDAPVHLERFPLDVLPVSLQDLCKAASVALHCPIDYLASAAIGLAGGVIGRSVSLRVRTSWEVTPNLYLAIVGPPGSRKSPALRLMARPLFDIDRRCRDDWKAAKELWKDEGKDNRGVEPVLSHLTLDDTTREAFAKILSENPRGLVLVKDELRAWVKDLDAYRQGKGSDKDFWMSLNSGQLIKVTRKGSPEPLVIVHPCGAIVGCLTPSSLPIMSGGGDDDGWIDRIMFTCPEPIGGTPKWNRPDIPTELLEEWNRSIDRLWSRKLVIDDIGSHPRPYYVRLTDRANEKMQEVYQAHYDEQGEGFPKSLIGVWSKYEGFFLRVALILSQLHQAYDPTNSDPPRDVDTLDVWGAQRLMTYFKSHFRHVRRELFGRPEDYSPDVDALVVWMQSHNIKTFTARDVSRHFPRFEVNDRDKAIAHLIRTNHIRAAEPAREPGKPGRPSRVFEVNPHIHLSGNVSDRIDKNPLLRPSPGLSRSLCALSGYLMTGTGKLGGIEQMATEENLSMDDIRQAAVLLGVEKTPQPDGDELWRLR